MKWSGGYTPRIGGRPAGAVEPIPLASQLTVELSRRGIAYEPLVKEGQAVEQGTPLAETSYIGGTLSIPSPASGTVNSVRNKEGVPSSVSIMTGGDAVDSFFRSHSPDRITTETTIATLARAGIWPFVWSSTTQGMPPLDGSERPRAIIVNCVSAEPFVTRGSVILSQSWGRVVSGLRFLPRLMGDYASIEFVLTDQHHPLAQKLYRELAGDAHLHFHPVPLRYPIEDPRVISNALLRESRTVGRADALWVIDVQVVAAVGACLGEGVPLHRRVVAIGGPGHPEPRHVDVHIGTPLSALPMAGCEASLILRGGMFTGEPVDLQRATIGADDTGFFCLPDRTDREFLSFVNPGADRTSILPCFISRLTRTSDRHISTYLRGERRPCIACTLCERVCPVGLMPQVLHRYLHNNQIDEAAATGVERCIGCGLCTYVCPSKIDLLQQFTEAAEQIRREREEVAATTDDEDRPKDTAWGGPLA